MNTLFPDIAPEKPKAKRTAITPAGERQGLLLSGLGCLPGQNDLFATDGPQEARQSVESGDRSFIFHAETDEQAATLEPVAKPLPLQEAAAIGGKCLQCGKATVMAMFCGSTCRSIARSWT